MSAADRFRTAVEAGDLDAMLATFAPDAVLYSPAKFAPIVGADAIRVLLGVIMRTFQDFRYVGELAGDVQRWAGTGAAAHVLVFRARVGDAQIHGIDLIHLDDSDRIAEFTVMIRPQSALLTLGAAVAEGLPVGGS